MSKENQTTPSYEAPLKEPHDNVNISSLEPSDWEESTSEGSDYEIVSSSDGSSDWSSDEESDERNGVDDGKGDYECKVDQKDLCGQCGQRLPGDGEVYAHCGGPYVEHFCCSRCGRLF
jgi:hypothetical protein